MKTAAHYFPLSSTRAYKAVCWRFDAFITRMIELHDLAKTDTQRAAVIGELNAKAQLIDALKTTYAGQLKALADLNGCLNSINAPMEQIAAIHKDL